MPLMSEHRINSLRAYVEHRDHLSEYESVAKRETRTDILDRTLVDCQAELHAIQRDRRLIPEQTARLINYGARAETAIKLKLGKGYTASSF